jgi:hypothetical protein
MLKKLSSPWILLLVAAAAIAVLTVLGPAERSLGANVRVVYLHGAWVWAALAAFTAAGLVGLIGLLLDWLGRGAKAGSKRPRSYTGWHRWSRALGRTGLLFWITYLPISMWAMQTNWNGLFLAEPRWRLAVVFSVGGLLLQVGIALVEDLRWASAANLVYLVALFLALSTTENVMHPASPILSSDAQRIQLYFAGLLALTLLAALQVARLWLQLEDQKVNPSISF